MKGLIFILGMTAVLCVLAIMLPHIGLIGYFGYAVLCPQWNWRWSITEDYGLQKYLAGAAMAGWMLKGLRGNRLQGLPLFAIACFVVFMMLAYVSSVSSINAERSEFYIDTMWKIVFMTALGVILLDTPGKIMGCLWAVVLAQGYNAFQVNDLYLEHRSINTYSFTWNFLDNNTYSISTIPPMAGAMALTLLAEKNWQRMLAGFIAAMQVHQIMLLASRGSMLGGLMLAALTIGFMPKTRRNVRLVLVGVVVASVLAGPSVVDEFMSSFKKEGDLDDSAAGRYKLWIAGWRITMDYPVLGVGPWAGSSLVLDYYPAEFGVHYQNDTVKALHNLFFEVSTGSGLPSAILFCAFYGAIWWGHLMLWWRSRHLFPPWLACINLTTLTAIPGYWAASMFSAGALIESPYVCAAMGAATLCVLAGAQRAIEASRDRARVEALERAQQPRRGREVMA